MSRRAAGGSRTAGALRGAAGMLILVALLEALVRSGLVDGEYFPAPSAVLGAAAGLLADPAFLGHLGATLSAALLGLALATAIGVPLGLVLGSFRGAQAAARGIIELLRPIPSVALIPLAILVLGSGLEMSVALIVYAAIWPILFNTMTAVRGADPVAADTARSFGKGRITILGAVVLPQAAPLVLTGIRVSAGIALILAITAEFIGGGQQGLGAWLLQTRIGQTRMDLMFAGIVFAGLLGLLLDAALRALERALLPWRERPAHRGGAA